MKILIDGLKNSVILFSDQEPPTDRVPLLSLKNLSRAPKSARLEGILYAIEKTVYLRVGDVIIPLAGRGKLNFEEFHGLPLTDDLYLDGSGSYFLMLDLEKA